MLRPTFFGFESAKRGISTAQKGLDITGQNLTNWDTPGYTRQRMDQVTLAASSYRTRYADNRIGVAGQGVDVRGISQVRDSFLDKRYRDECGNAGYFDQKLSFLQDIEDALSEKDLDGGMTAMLEQARSALTNFASNANSETDANIVATSFKSIVQLLHQFSTKLDDVAAEQKYDLGLAVDEVNSIFQKISNLNQTISEDVGVTGAPPNEYFGPNELLDERNLLLDQLARYGDMDVTTHTDGTVTLKMNGHTVVEGSKYDTINYFDTFQNGTASLNWQSSGKEVQLTKGGLKASVDTLNGRGTGVVSGNESVDKGVMYYKDKINTFSRTLTSVFNNIIPETDADGNIKMDGNQIVYKKLLGATIKDADGKFQVSQDVPITAENITLSEEWNKDSSYVMFKKDSKDSTYINAMITALSENKNTVFNNSGEVFQGTFSDFVKDYAVASLGAEISFYQGRSDATESIASDLDARRDEISGVSQDEETANMMLYQKTLNAASRLFNVMDEALDTIINKMGLVGR